MRQLTETPGKGRILWARRMNQTARDYRNTGGGWQSAVPCHRRRSVAFPSEFIEL
jgi:hypothetical protein